MSWENEIVKRDITEASILVSERIRGVISGQVDLEETLEEASTYQQSHRYSTHPREWPPLVEVLDSKELPPVLIERYNAAGGEDPALCGIFPEIRRAWASAHNSLFLWRFDKSDNQCKEFNAGEQAICAVGLVKPKPGSFADAYRYLLVLATPVELLLTGVRCSGNGDEMDPYAEVSLFGLAQYTIPSDGVTMTCIACTNRGHIFMAGCDGHIYEMHYTGSLWGMIPCEKFCLTGGLGSVVSRWLVPNVLKCVDPIVEMAVDNERHILYARTKAMKIQVYSLGQNDDAPLKKVTEKKNLINQRDLLNTSRQVAGSRAATLSTQASIVSISPLSTAESKWLHLVAILSDGRRMYLSTTKKSGTVGAFSNNLQKPSCLEVVTTRPAPPLRSSYRDQNVALNIKINTAHYSSATLVLSDSSSSITSSLSIVNRDSTTHSSNLGTGLRSSRLLLECVSSLPIEGRMLAVAEVLPLPETASTVKSLYAQLGFSGYVNSGESPEKLAGKLWARGDLPTQHILPRRRIIVLSTMRTMEVVFNRPVDILRRLLESNTPRTILEDFLNRFGAVETSGMCLMLAARVVHTDISINDVVAEKAAEAFEDPRVVGVPHEGLCLCASRLLLPVWELPLLAVDVSTNEIVEFRLSVEVMGALEDKLRRVEKFLKSRRNQRRGIYGSVGGLGDLTGSILVEAGDSLVSGHRGMTRNVFSSHSKNLEASEVGTSSKRQRLPYDPTELAFMEVRAMECVRQLLLRCGEALFLLQLLSRYHVTRLLQCFDQNTKQALAQLTFHQLVCSEEGDKLASRLVSSLMDYYTSPDVRGTADEISGRLREGCPSFYKYSDYEFYLAVGCLVKAANASNDEERETLARDAFCKLSPVPESADLQTLCNRFEDLRFYEAVVRLPLLKAHTLDPYGDALNDQIDAGIREHALAQRERCYEVIISGLRSLKGEVSQRNFRSPSIRSSAHSLAPAAQKKYICQIIQHGVQSNDKIFHEYLYRNLIDLGLEDELLEFGGPDLVPFLQNAGCDSTKEFRAVSGPPISFYQTKYFELLARYYVLKRQHVHAAHVLLRLAERRCSGIENDLTADQRRQYLSDAVFQAKSATYNDSQANSSRDSGLLDLLEGKLTVVQFQIKIIEELQGIVSRIEASPSTSNANNSDAATVKEKVKELSLDLKNIIQLYNEYAVPFELWEICLEITYFASYSGDTDSNIWARLMDQALSKGGIAEASAVLKRIGSHVYQGDSAVLPLDVLCLHLEKAASERVASGVEAVGDEDVARALMAACKGAVEPVLNTYDNLLSSAVILSSSLKLRLLRSVLVVVQEWAVSVSATGMGTNSIGASLSLRRTFPVDQITALNRGIRDKITSAANRYLTEVRTLALPQRLTDTVYRGFKELEEFL